jgi:HAD superfamily hydrolase (TIGR01509 family)
MRRTAIRGIIFDFDGVLVDSEPIRFRAGVEALAEIGVSLTWELFAKHWLGRTDEVGLRDILGPRFETEGAGVIARRNTRYEGLLAEVPFFPDAIRLLDRLPPELSLAIASGSRRLEVTTILARVGLSHRFHALVSAGDYARAKPFPDPFLLAARGLDIPPKACLVVEDSPAGVVAGRAAGMAVVAVDRRGAGDSLAERGWRVASLDAVEIAGGGDVFVHRAG